MSQELKSILTYGLKPGKSADYEALRNLIIKALFVNMCPASLTIHLGESSFGNFIRMCNQAERYLQVHSQKFSANNHSQQREYYNCGKFGHIKAECCNVGRQK